MRRREPRRRRRVERGDERRDQQRRQDPRAGGGDAGLGEENAPAPTMAPSTTTTVGTSVSCRASTTPPGILFDDVALWSAMRLPATALAALAVSATLGCAHGSLFLVDDGTAALHDGPGTGVISDFDDTIAVTHVTNKLKMILGVLFTQPEDVVPVAGVADAFARAADAGAAPFVYVSASPTFLRDRIRAFLDDEGLPDGPLVLKDWRTDPPGDPSSKKERILAVLEKMPSRKFVLVGDTGERDPEIYASIARERPEQVAGIVVVTTEGSDLRPERFEGMLVVDDYADAPDALARFVD